ncbi:MAG: putative baseplate assembly protein [Isosphaeraceae bacterium]
MARGRIDPPNLDDRTWKDLVEQARALIPHYAPEWTDPSLSDPGMVLVELFAWLVEGMTYRLNRVPEKNYIAFLNLLGITRAPATPATTWLTYTSSTPVTLPAGTQAATQQTESQPAVVFETDEDLDVANAELVELLYTDQDISPATTWSDLNSLVVPASPGRTDGPPPGFDWQPAEPSALSIYLGFDERGGTFGPHTLYVEVPEIEREAPISVTAQWVDSLGKLQPFPEGSFHDQTTGLARSGTIWFDPPKDWGRVLRYKKAGGDGTEQARHWVLLTLTPHLGTPQWIWHGQPDKDGTYPDETRYFRRTFSVDEVSRLALGIRADDKYTLYLDGQEVTSAGIGWDKFKQVEAMISPGQHVLAVQAVNWQKSQAGLLVRGGVLPLGAGVLVHTDSTWKSSGQVPSGSSWTDVNYDDSDWPAAQAIGELGIAPWGTPTFDISKAEERIGIPPGTSFETELAVIRIKHILFNSVRARAVETVLDEFVGVGNGRPYQSFELVHRPIYKDVRSPGTPYGHVSVSVNGEQWKLVDEFEVGNLQKAFRLDPTTGTIHFGSDLPESKSKRDSGGMAPPRDSRITASYRHVPTGASGNVAAGVVNTQRSVNNAITSVTNPFRATDGADEEAIEDTKRRAPLALKNFDRAVTADDYKALALRASNVVRKVRCLGPAFDEKGNPLTFGNLIREEGRLNVLIVPDVADPAFDPRPEPTFELLREVQASLDSRRLLGTRLVVSGPRYLPITISLRFQLWPSAVDLGSGKEGLASQLIKRLTAEVVSYLHPVKGGKDGKGWEIGQDFLVSGLFMELQAIIGDLGYINEISATPVKSQAARPPFRDDFSGPSIGVRVADHELICSADSHEIAPWSEADRGNK